MHASAAARCNLNIRRGLCIGHLRRTDDGARCAKAEGSQGAHTLHLAATRNPWGLECKQGHEGEGAHARCIPLLSKRNCITLWAVHEGGGSTSLQSTMQHGKDLTKQFLYNTAALQNCCWSKGGTCPGQES
eukprot:1144941-Pelagomonas_calceolata.AAC.2